MPQKRPSKRWTTAIAACGLSIGLSAAPSAAVTLGEICSAQFWTATGEVVTGTADLNGDRTVDGADLHLLMDAWGPVHRGPDFNADLGADAKADVNADGAVDCFDLHYVLGNRGPCPLANPDANGDGQVNYADSALIYSYYGACTLDVDGDGEKEQQEPSLDLDNNGRVDDVDAAIVVCLFGRDDRGDPDADFDRNGRVDERDLRFVLRGLGSRCPFDLDQDGWIGWPDVEVVVRTWG